jgi:hypothetical protein
MLLFNFLLASSSSAQTVQSQIPIEIQGRVPTSWPYENQWDARIFSDDAFYNDVKQRKFRADSFTFGSKTSSVVEMQGQVASRIMFSSIEIQAKSVDSQFGSNALVGSINQLNLTIAGSGANAVTDAQASLYLQNFMAIGADLQSVKLGQVSQINAASTNKILVRESDNMYVGDVKLNNVDLDFRGVGYAKGLQFRNQNESCKISGIQSIYVRENVLYLKATSAGAQNTIETVLDLKGVGGTYTLASGSLSFEGGFAATNKSGPLANVGFVIGVIVAIAVFVIIAKLSFNATKK